jgi:hypothetical protein
VGGEQTVDCTWRIVVVISGENIQKLDECSRARDLPADLGNMVEVVRVVVTVIGLLSRQSNL